MKRSSERLLFYLLWSITFIVLLFIAFRSLGTYDSGDGVTHYFISRFSFRHPYLLLDLWGKPFFTLLSSPFSQFGLRGITCFNILCGMLSALCAWKIASLLQLKYAWAVLFFCIFAPVYFGVLNSGLTEPLFSFMLIFSILLVFLERPYWAALVFSFAPFVRPEANFLLAVFAVYFVFSKKFKAIPLLFAGTVFYSLVGFFISGNIFWLKTDSPYSAGNATKYGNVHGELLSYVSNYESILGLPITILFVLGCVFLLLLPLLRKRKVTEIPFVHLKEEVLLLYGCLFACIVVHSIVWWKGIFPTLGLYRYMSCIIPLAAVLCLRGLDTFFAFIKDIYLRLVIIVPLLLWVASVPFREYYFPFPLDPEQMVAYKASEWMKANPYMNERIYAMHPSVTLMTGLDPYDGEHAPNPSAIHAEDPGKDIPSKSIVIWDGHYGANDNHLPIKCLLESKDYKLLQKFVPDQPFNVFGDIPFEIYIFQRI